MNLPKRKPTRLKDFDYSAEGAYFLTICTYQRRRILSNIVGAIHESPLRRSLISKAMGYLKMNTSKEMHRAGVTDKIWQRSFHDHIIRGKEDYREIVEYIYNNPLRWQYDCFYTEEDA